MKVIRFYIIAIAIIICDQVSKWAVVQHLPLGLSRPVLGSVLALTHTHNTGGAFSLFQARNDVFIVIAAVAIVALLYAYHRYQRDDLLISAALSLALGGAVGNLIDRVQYHYVIDFFDIHVWPIFNIADSAITIGIIMLAYRFVFSKEQTASREQSPSAPSSPPKA